MAPYRDAVVLQEFFDALAEAGLTPHEPSQLLAALGDGQLVRFRVSGDKAGSRNGWAVLYMLPSPAGAFGSWRTGQHVTWSMRPAAGETAAQRAQRRRNLDELHARWQAERQRVQAEAAGRAGRLWAAARPATDDHPYLRRKGVHAYGLRRLRDALLIPARDAEGKLHTLQFIDAAGQKRFLSGGRIAGCYCSIGLPGARVYVCEGIATGATVHAVTGAAVAVAFSSGNLLPVAVALRQKLPARTRIVIAADNDLHTPGNPGVTAAYAAARAVGGLVAVPDLAALTGGPTA